MYIHFVLSSPSCFAELEIINCMIFYHQCLQDDTILGSKEFGGGGGAKHIRGT